VLFERPLRLNWRPCYYEEEGRNVSIRADGAYTINENDVNRKFARTVLFVDNGETVVGDTDNSRIAAKQVTFLMMTSLWIQMRRRTSIMFL
jgi:hypothetical protein